MEAPIPQIIAKLWKCSRCGHQWLSRVPVPLRCSSCKSPYWNRAYERGPDAAAKNAAIADSIATAIPNKPFIGDPTK